MSGIKSFAARTPWPFGTALPQRFGIHYQRYQQLGGLVDVTEDARAYAGLEQLRDVERLMFLSLAFDQIHKEGLEGDFLELGVYQGSTAAVLARYARRLDRQLYLLDTYEGFVEEDLNGLDAGRRVDFTDTSLDAVRTRVGEVNTKYVKGYFPESAKQLPADGRYCLVHIDTDLYSPIMSGLEYFYPRMVPGGYLIVHDYGSLAWDGAERAVDIFFADKPECVIQIPDSSGSAVIRRLRSPDTGPTWIAKRQALIPEVWHVAANGLLGSVLIDGWSVPESWGVWGVGRSHTIQLKTAVPVGSHAVVDIDFNAFVWDEDVGRQFDVIVNGQSFTTVVLSKARGSVNLVLKPLHSDENNMLMIAFVPRMVASPRQFNQSSNDMRELGIGLHRIRLRYVRDS